ncbi:hypothetical protein BGW38_000291, partial [Lunasporangiospora selenospora]
SSDPESDYAGRSCCAERRFETPADVKSTADDVFDRETMGIKTFIRAPTSAPHLQDFFEEVPVEKFTAISFFTFNEFAYSDRQTASTEYKEKVYDYAFSKCPASVTKAMSADWSRGKTLRSSYWKDVQAKEEEDKRLQRHMSNMEADVIDRSEISSSILTKKFKASAESAGVQISSTSTPKGPDSDEDYSYGAERQSRPLHTSNAAKKRKHNYRLEGHDTSSRSDNSRQHQQQVKGNLKNSQIIFDPTTIVISQLVIEGIEIGTSFRMLQEEVAPMINDVKELLMLHQLPCFLAANYIWDITYQLPGMSDNDHATVQASLCVPVIRLSDQLVLFCRTLVHDLKSKGYICSRDSKSRDQNDLLVLFQQASQKLPIRFLPFIHLRNEDTHAHSALDSLLTFVFPAYHQRYELHWANRASDGSRARRGGDALKPDATIVKDGFELGFVEVKPPKEERHHRAYLEDVWALSGFAKDCIDLHLRHSRILTTAPCVLVFGFQMTLYQLSFQAGIYVWQHVDTSYLPKDQYDSGNVIECVELLKTFKAIMDKAETGRYVRTLTKHVESDDELPDLFRPQLTNVSPSKRPFFSHT